ncbi:probable cyclin-dependent serine/threonine-protein kinase DDB_G0292550 [Chenopodium quinoa]|uniref:probable cyclin-dependent serine/threonine-protein kinase DDB_G0292550 n=1 Tax=Chenopodium quinoa TaxID=63459 RepID=UPI000B79543D|nr:probable cyclin-dependent serine/threonine-protein kinase DDB_G0292550 [Chenopodium quinoa]
MAIGSGNNNNGGELSEVVKQLVVVAQQLARNSTNNGDAQGKLFKKVAQSKPPTYQGEPDPIEKVRDKFYPSFLQKQKTEEFANLAMGEMSVTEYYTKFIELSRFAKESVATEKSKARKFESGLTTDLQLKLCGQVFDTLDEVYGRAAHLYALELKKKKELAEIEGKEKRKEVGQNSRNPQGNHNNFKKLKYQHNNNNNNNNNNNFHNNNFQGNNCQGGRNFNGGSRNSNQGNNKGPMHFYCKRCRTTTLGNNQGGAQRNFQGNNNYLGTKGTQQNGAKSNNIRNNQVKSGALGKLNVMSRHVADSTKDVITGTFSINSIPVKVLFGSGATFSFISKAIVSKLAHCLKP